jgi:glycine/serine hydroxymethyltransferase
MGNAIIADMAHIAGIVAKRQWTVGISRPALGPCR